MGGRLQRVVPDGSVCPTVSASSPRAGCGTTSIGPERSGILAAMNPDLAALKVPTALRPRAGEVIAITDAFCAEYLDDEYGTLCRRLVARLSRKRPSPLERGDARIWAAGVIYALGSDNFLFDPSSEPHMRSDQVAAGLGVKPATMANKGRTIRDLLDIVPFAPETSRRDVLDANPLAWLVMVDGIIVDARWLPPELQAQAHRQGLIPAAA